MPFRDRSEGNLLVKEIDTLDYGCGDIERSHPGDGQCAALSHAGSGALSVENPTWKASSLQRKDFEKWLAGLPAEDAESLVDYSVGKRVRRVPGDGWVEEE